MARNKALPIWPELADSALIDHQDRTFMVAFERDSSGITPYDCDLPAANSPERCEMWERGQWHYASITVTAVDADLKAIELPGASSTRTYSGLPSDGDLSSIALRLCAEITFALNCAPGV